jgi:hypothetical protein
VWRALALDHQGPPMRIHNLYADADGFSKADSLTLQRFLEKRYHLDPCEAKKKAEIIQNAAKDGVITNKEAKQLKDEFVSVVGKKNVDAQFAAITGKNKKALLLGRTQFLDREKIFEDFFFSKGKHQFLPKNPLDSKMLIPMNPPEPKNLFPNDDFWGKRLRKNPIKFL